MSATDASVSCWVLYLLECHGGTYYAGITNNLAKRLQAHQEGRGARYTRARRPRRLLGYRVFADRSEASKAEWAIKQLPRRSKLAFLRVREEVAHDR